MDRIKQLVDFRPKRLYLMRSSGWYLYQAPHQAQHSYSRCSWFSAPCVLTEFLLWYFPWHGKTRNHTLFDRSHFSDKWQKKELTSWRGNAASYELLLKRRLSPNQEDRTMKGEKSTIGYASKQAIKVSQRQHI